jgi:dihydroflavonol-4-reductase
VTDGQEENVIAVVGAAGFLGHHVLRAAASHGTRAVVRRETTWVRAAKSPVAIADLDDPKTLRKALEGARVIVHAAGHYPKLSLDHCHEVSTAIRQTRNLFEAAAAVGAERVVLLSSVATVAPASGRASDEHDVFASRPEIGTYHSVKYAIERVALTEATVPVVIACPGACFGPGDWRFGTGGAALALARGHTVALPDGYVNPVDARDVAQGIVQLATMDDPPPRLLMAGNSLLASDLLERVRRHFGGRGTLRILPAAVARTLADNEERRVAKQGGRPRLSREIVDLILHGVLVDTNLAEKTLGITWTPLGQTLDDFLAWTGLDRTAHPEPAEVR